MARNDHFPTNELEVASMSSIGDEEYLKTIRVRMYPTYDVSEDQIDGRTVLVAYRSKFKLNWMATKLHFFIVVADIGTVSSYSLENLTRAALDFAKSEKGQFRGLASGVGVVAAAVSYQVSESAKDFARSHRMQEFAAVAWPMVVDLSSDETCFPADKPLIGRIYDSWMREQVRTIFR